VRLLLEEELVQTLEELHRKLGLLPPPQGAPRRTWPMFTREAVAKALSLGGWDSPTPEIPTPVVTLRQGRQFIQEALQQKKGGDCPCCGQRVLVSAERFRAGCAILLRYVDVQTTDEEPWFAVSAFPPWAPQGGIRNWSKLRYWDLVEEKSNVDPSKRSSGAWRLTSFGRRWTRQQERIPERAHLFNGQCYGFTGDMVTVRQVLERADSDFDYQGFWDGCEGNA
jgi:hypothetical protein